MWDLILVIFLLILKYNIHISQLIYLKVIFRVLRPQSQSVANFYVKFSWTFRTSNFPGAPLCCFPPHWRSMASRIDAQSGSLSLSHDPSLSSLWLLSSQILILLVAIQNRAKQERTNALKWVGRYYLHREGGPLPCEIRWVNPKSSLRVRALYSLQIVQSCVLSTCLVFIHAAISPHWLRVYQTAKPALLQSVVPKLALLLRLLTTLLWNSLFLAFPGS